MCKKLFFCVSMLMVLFISSSCAKISNENCVFLNERANLHEEYIISVTSIGKLDNIYVYKNKNDTEKSEVIGTTKHYLYVELHIEHQGISDPQENHELDMNDFKIKDHTGVQIDNITFVESFEAAEISKVDFATRNAIEDYAWVDTQIEPGESRDLILYFEFEKELDIINTLMVLEVDFFATKKGTDIVLINRV